MVSSMATVVPLPLSSSCSNATRGVSRSEKTKMANRSYYACTT